MNPSIAAWRTVRSTREAITAAHLAGRVAGGTNAPVRDILGALTDRLVNVGARRRVEQFLIGVRVLHHGGGFAVDGERHA